MATKHVKINLKDIHEENPTSIEELTTIEIEELADKVKVEDLSKEIYNRWVFNDALNLFEMR